MKKLFLLLIALVILISSIPCIAANGDIAGNIYFDTSKLSSYYRFKPLVDRFFLKYAKENCGLY